MTTLDDRNRIAELAVSTRSAVNDAIEAARRGGTWERLRCRSCGWRGECPDLRMDESCPICESTTIDKETPHA